jgi:hypothetical protein
MLKESDRYKFQIMKASGVIDNNFYIQKELEEVSNMVEDIWENNKEKQCEKKR